VHPDPGLMALVNGRVLRRAMPWQLEYHVSYRRAITELACRNGPNPSAPWRKMPKRFRPYGSAEDAESAVLGRGRPRAGGELLSDLASTVTAPEIASQVAEAVRELSDLTSDGAGFASLDGAREVIASLERMAEDLPRLCEQLARILVVQHEEGQIAQSPGHDPDFWVVEVVQALAAAGQAADMMTAALTQARRTSAELRSAR
jgi:hypothetical protein